MDLASSTRATEYRTWWRGIVVKSPVMPPTTFQAYGIEQNRIYYIFKISLVREKYFCKELVFSKAVSTIQLTLSPWLDG